MSEMESKPKRTPSKSRQGSPTKVLRFIEELSWLLDRYGDVDLRATSRELLQINKSPAPTGKNAVTPSAFEGFAPSNPNKMVLVGVLPGMFTDETLFPSNEDIAEFAENVLEVRIPRWDKKSKFELIGHIACNTSIADDAKLCQIASALKRMSTNDTQAKNIIETGRREKKNWNEIIQQLIDG